MKHCGNDSHFSSDREASNRIQLNYRRTILFNIQFFPTGKNWMLMTRRRDEAFSLDIRETVRSHHYEATDVNIKGTVANNSVNTNSELDVDDDTERVGRYSGNSKMPEVPRETLNMLNCHLIQVQFSRRNTPRPLPANSLGTFSRCPQVSLDPHHILQHPLQYPLVHLLFGQNQLWTNHRP